MCWACSAPRETFYVAVRTRLFVARDPMELSPPCFGESAQHLCLNPGDRITVLKNPQEAVGYSVFFLNFLPVPGGNELYWTWTAKLDRVSKRKPGSMAGPKIEAVA